MGRLLSLALGLVVIATACGREDVELLVYISRIPDAGSANVVDAATCHELARSCLSRGNTCSASADCCTGRCETGVCLEASCGAPETPCTTRAECCSGACEATGSGRACLPYCRADGMPCTRALDCCGLACMNGACGGPPCAARGGSCETGSDCCSGICAGGSCEIEPSLVCRPLGEDCTSGSGSGCCGACGAADVCVPGPGPCLGAGVACESAADCCHGTCVADATGRRLCTSPCGGGGDTCATNADCCSKSCTLPGSRCAAEPTSCKRVGEKCATAAECCSGSCDGGSCAADCR